MTTNGLSYPLPANRRQLRTKDKFTTLRFDGLVQVPLRGVKEKDSEKEKQIHGKIYNFQADKIYVTVDPMFSIFSDLGYAEIGGARNGSPRRLGG
ncbi:hypothetical protein ACJ72_01426 [Emergomyces africanus]|uniref:Uncharacterized protein n=1 Tax=Emergomyces africanus TaxID=1955775 RepID=A0A1B7P5B9_9EURO|nr:hypothetical protein ACJ72_01426 [Emergomyces africanus]